LVLGSLYKLVSLLAEKHQLAMADIKERAILRELD